MAAMVATSPAMPPAPVASVALKLITQAGDAGSCTASSGAPAVEVSDVMEMGPARFLKGSPKGCGEPPGRCEECGVCAYKPLSFSKVPWLQSPSIVVT